MNMQVVHFRSSYGGSRANTREIESDSFAELYPAATREECEAVPASFGRRLCGKPDRFSEYSIWYTAES